MRSKLHLHLSRQRRRGQALAEFALILPLLMLVVLIAIDAGRLFYGWVTVNNAARIAANYAAATPAGPFTVGSTYATTVRNETSHSNCTVATIPTPVFAPDTSVGSTATVSLSCSFRLLTPFISGFIGSGGNVTLSASSTFLVKGGIIAGVPISTAAVPGSTPSPTPTTTATPAPTSTPIPVCNPGQQNVPNLVGLTVADARALWISSGFTGAFKPSNSNFDADTVTGQNPPVGECDPVSSGMTVQHK